MDISNVEKMIYLVRGHKVMLDSDLAELYGVETRIINRNIKRNLQRFPEDFMFQLSEQEVIDLRSQIGISNQQGGRRYLPYVFTENGVAMLSSVLNSERAIQVNIAIMRIFTKLRSFLMLEEQLSSRMDNLEGNSKKLFRVVFERLDNLEVATPALRPGRKKISLKKENF